MFLSASLLYPAQLSYRGKVTVEAVGAAPVSLVWHASQEYFGQFLDIIRVDASLPAFGSPFFGPGCPVKSCRPAKSVLIVVEDICLRSADIRVDAWRAMRGTAGKEFSDEPAAAEGTEEAAPFRSQGQSHGSP